MIYFHIVSLQAAAHQFTSKHSQYGHIPHEGPEGKKEPTSGNLFEPDGVTDQIGSDEFVGIQ